MNRSFFPSALVVVACLASPFLSVPQVMAEGTGPRLSQAQAGFYRLKIGDVEITALSDGTIGLDTKLLGTRR